MPDTKITALTAISTVDPAVDVLPIVDVSDTTMAASGTTKKITSNQILGAGGTATLASATITGDLTVDTNVLKVDTSNNRVSVNTTTFATDSVFAVKTTAGKFDVRAAGSLSVKLNSDQSMLYNVPTGNIHLFQINDSDAMTLNSTGLAIGDTAFAGTRLTLRESASQPNALAMTNRNATQTWGLSVDTAAVDDKILGFYDSTSTAFRVQLYDTGHFVTTVPTTPPTLNLNSTAVWNLTSNTNLRVSVRGTDGVTRTANITLA